MSVGIVTTCYSYFHFLPDWTKSVANLNRKPDKVVLATKNPSHQHVLQISEQTKCDFVAVKIDQWNFADALNTAISACNTDWIVWIGCDDWFYPHALDGWENSKYDVVNFGLEFPDKSYKRIQNPPTKEDVLDLSNRNLMPCGSPFRRYLWENIPFSKELSPYEDWGFSIGAAIQNAKFGSTERIDYVYRIHRDQIRYDDAPIIKRISQWKDKMING